MKICFKLFMILSMAANAAAFIIALDERMDFLTWSGYHGWTTFGNTALVLTMWIPAVYAVGLVAKKFKERRSKRYLTRKVMYLL